MRAKRTALEAAFTLTGFSSLSLQIAWQRVLAGDGGKGLASSTTVIAAFLAGMGLGSLLGGAIADRVSSRRAVRIYALVNLGVALTAAASLAVFAGGEASWIPRFESELASFGFHFVLLAIPAAFMGVSLPLLAKGVVKRSKEMPELVGRLYSLNVFGSAVGAASTTWFLLSWLGVEGTTWACAAIQAAAAFGVLVVFRGLDREAATRTKPPAEPHPWRWYATALLLGATALGLELVYFQVGESLMREQTRSFGHVLTLFYVFYAAGAAWGAMQAEHARSPGKTFHLLQLGVAVSALLGLGATRLLEGNEGVVIAWVVAPVIMLSAPVFLLGASFPFVLAAAKSSSAASGGRVGALQGALIAGNVGGTLLTGFVLLERLGPMRTAMVFAAFAALTALPLPRAGERVGMRRNTTASSAGPSSTGSDRPGRGVSP